MLALLERLGGPWEQQDGHAKVRIRFCVAFGTILASHFERLFGHRIFRGFSVRIRFQNLFCADFAIEVQTPGVSIPGFHAENIAKRNVPHKPIFKGSRTYLCCFSGVWGFVFQICCCSGTNAPRNCYLAAPAHPKLDHTGTFPGKFFGDILLRHCHVTNISQEQMRHIILFFIANVIKSWYQFLS